MNFDDMDLTEFSIIETGTGSETVTFTTEEWVTNPDFTVLQIPYEYQHVHPWRTRIDAVWNDHEEPQHERRLSAWNGQITVTGTNQYGERTREVLEAILGGQERPTVTRIDRADGTSQYIHSFGQYRLEYPGEFRLDGQVGERTRWRVGENVEEWGTFEGLRGILENFGNEQPAPTTATFYMNFTSPSAPAMRDIWMETSPTIDDGWVRAIQSIQDQLLQLPLPPTEQQWLNPMDDEAAASPIFTDYVRGYRYGNPPPEACTHKIVFRQGTTAEVDRHYRELMDLQQMQGADFDMDVDGAWYSFHVRRQNVYLQGVTFEHPVEEHYYYCAEREGHYPYPYRLRFE